MSGHPRTHQNAILRTYAGLLLISICVYTLMYAPQPMFNSVSRDFGVDKGSTGLLVSVFMLSLAVSPLCVGMLLSRIGVRRAILGASLLLGISGVGIWFAPSFLVLLGIRALQALLVPVVLTAVMSGIAVMFRHLDRSNWQPLHRSNSSRIIISSLYLVPLPFKPYFIRS